jgi:dipeptidyl aminopeptidase/acylaminoacyl peptidase
MTKSVPEVNIIADLQYVGANRRASLLDVFLPQNKGKLPLIIFLHGFKGFKNWGHFDLLAQHWAEGGFVVVKPNFSHNGGTVSQAVDFPDLNAFANNTYTKELTDINYVIDFCLSRDKVAPYIDKQSIYLVGHSRGGSMAILAGSTDQRVKKIVSWATPASLFERLPDEKALTDWERKGVRYIPNSRTGQDMPMKYSFVRDLQDHRDQLDLQLAVKKTDKPILIVHGIADETVSYKNALRLKEWSNRGEMELIKDAGHTFGGQHPYEKEALPQETVEAADKTINFLNRN